MTPCRSFGMLQLLNQSNSRWEATKARGCTAPAQMSVQHLRRKVDRGWVLCYCLSMEQDRKPDQTISTRSLIVLAENYEVSRKMWIDMLVDRPQHTVALSMVASISAKIEMLDSLLRSAYIYRGINDHEL